MQRGLLIVAAGLALAACQPAQNGGSGSGAPSASAPAAAPAAPATPAFAADYPGAANVSHVAAGPGNGVTHFDTTDAPAQIGAHYTQLGQAAGMVPRNPGEGADPGIVYTASGPAGEITVLAPAAGADGQVHATVTWTVPSP